MPETLFLPFISLGIIVLLGATVLVWRQANTDAGRRLASVALGVNFALLLAAAAQCGLAHGVRLLEPFTHELFAVDALNAIPLAFFGALALGFVILAPKRKVTPHWLAGTLFLTAATLAGYAANHFLVLALAWIGTIAPFFIKSCFEVPGEKELPTYAKASLAASCLLLIAGLAFLIGGAPAVGWSMSVPRTGESTPLRIAFGLLTAAVVFRKGLLPMHSWVVTAFERGPLLPLTLLFNGHFGAFLLARVLWPLLPDLAHPTSILLGDLGLLTAAYAAIIALVERQPRRLLAFLFISQSSFVLVGLESGNADGIAGALVHWQVVSLATALLTAVYASLEARLSISLDNPHFLGLANAAPRLAVFFAVGGLALVGLPLTLGFPAEDLLIHGTLESHPQFGILLPIVTALNAFHILRLFAVLFLGRANAAVRHLADALPRERWVLTALLAVLLLGGIAPQPFVQLPAQAAERLVSLVTGKAEMARKH